MGIRSRLLVAIVCMFVISIGAGAAGCEEDKPAEDDSPKSKMDMACDNMVDLKFSNMPNKQAGVDACYQAIQPMVEPCTNRDAILDCMAEARDMQAFNQCAATCERM